MVKHLNSSLEANILQKTYESTYKYRVAMGQIDGQTTWNKFGYNLDIDTTGQEVISSFGGTFTPLLTESVLSFVSTSANDVNGGTGCHGLVVYGIDSGRNSKIEVVFMNGTTPVVSTSLWLGVNRVSIFRAGSLLVNEGRIDITAGAAIQAQLPAGSSTTEQLIFFTQVGHTAMIDWLYLNAQKTSGGGNPKVTFIGYVYSSVSNARYEVFRFIIDTQTESSLNLRPSQPFVVGEKSCFWVEALTDVNNTQVNGRFSLIELKN